MSRARFGHRQKIDLQVFVYQHVYRWAERATNFLTLSLFTNLLILLSARNAGSAKNATRGHKLGTLFCRTFYIHFPFRRPLLPSKFSTCPCAYLNPDHRLSQCRLANIGVTCHQRFCLSFPVSVVTVLIRRTVTFYVFLGQRLSLRKLCVAHSRAKGAFSENSSGFILRLCYRHARVYAYCHAQLCAGSRAVRASRSSTSVPPALQRQRQPQTCAAQEVDLSQGASVWGRLA
jgi:hypothetical protein